jgi:hypothetical protein
MVCSSGISRDVVECIFMQDAPDTESTCVGVVAIEKMSVICACFVSPKVKVMKGSLGAYHRLPCAW